MLNQFRRLEVQAVWALGLGLLSLGPSLAAAFLAFRNYNGQLGRIVYGAEGRFILLFAGCVITSAALAFPGFVLGWSSAGHSRNDRSAASWAGFFLGGVALSANIVLLLALYMLRLRLD